MHGREGIARGRGRRQAIATCLLLLLAALGRVAKAAAVDGAIVPAAGAAAAQPAAEPPLFRFGVVTDVQYADKPTAGARRYAASLGLLRACVADLNTRELAFVIQLGDLVDGNGAKTRGDLDRVLALFHTLKAPLHHVIGNHCLTVPRPALMEALGLAKPYYAFELPGWRFVVLDGMDVSASQPESAAGARQAREYLAKDPKLPLYNGAIGEAQMAWLRAQLAGAAREGRKVIVFCHHPALAAAGTRSTILWNGAEVARTLVDAGCVVAYFSGHEHRGGYAAQNGIHHVTVPGMVEAPEGSTAYALVEGYRDHLLLRGFGSVPTRELRW